MPVTILIGSVTRRDRRIYDKAKNKLPANNLARLASTQFITGTIRSLELAHNYDKLGSKKYGVKWRLCVKSKQRKRIFSLMLTSTTRCAGVLSLSPVTSVTGSVTHKSRG